MLPQLKFKLHLLAVFFLGIYADLVDGKARTYANNDEVDLWVNKVCAL